MTKIDNKYATPVRWTTEEARLVATGTALRLVNHPSRSVGRHVLKTVRAVQAAYLPADRQRALHAYHNLRQFVPQIEAQLHRLDRTQRASDIKEELPHKAQVQVQAQSPVPVAVAATPTLESTLNTLIDLLSARITQSVVEALSNKFIITARTSGVNEVQSAITPDVLVSGAGAATTSAKEGQSESQVLRPKHNPEAPSSPRVRKLTVGVIGLLNGQRTVMIEKFPDIDFRFFSGTKSMKHPPAVDRIIGMVGFMSHATDGMAQKQFGLHYHRVSNGITSLSNKVQALRYRYEIQSAGADSKAA